MLVLGNLSLMETEKKKFSLINNLPAIYQERSGQAGDLYCAFLTSFEDLFYLIEERLDNIEIHFNPYLTPALPDKKGHDFLSWLASWVVFGIDERWSETKKRYLIKIAAMLYLYRGTPIGLKFIIEQFFDIEVEIKEWDWPGAIEIGRRSSIGVDTFFVGDLDIKQCFIITWKPPYPDNREEIIRKMRTVIDLEKPAHTYCYLRLEIEKEIRPDLLPMVVGINSTLCFCYIS